MFITDNKILFLVHVKEENIVELTYSCNTYEQAESFLKTQFNMNYIESHDFKAYFKGPTATAYIESCHDIRHYQFNKGVQNENNWWKTSIS